MTKKPVEAVVIQAFSEPDVEHDQLIDFIGGRIAEEHARSSDASESAAKVTAFLEETKLNSQALNWAKTIIKKLPKKDGQAKAMDIIRSLKYLLVMVENHVAGQGTGEMQLEPTPEPEKPEDDPQDVEVGPHTLEEDGDKPADAEIADFEKDVEEAMGDDTVTPVDFNRSAG